MGKSYDEMYLPDQLKLMGEAFDMVREKFPDIDERWFIESFMRSNIRALMDECNPYWLARLPGELVKQFIREEFSGNYPKGAAFEPYVDFKFWLGRMYAYCQWDYGVSSVRLLELLPLDLMSDIFIWGHQMGEKACSAKILSEVLGGCV